jgi:predicted metalloprotease with PDZ domain
MMFMKATLSKTQFSSHKLLHLSQTRLPAAVLALWILCAAQFVFGEQVEPTRSLRYVLSPGNDETNSIVVSVQGRGFGETKLGLCSSGWAGIRECTQGLAGVSREDQPGHWVPLKADKTGFWSIPGNTGGTFSIQYTLAPSSMPSNDPQRFKRPILRPDFIHLVGHTALMTPVGLARNERFELEVDARALTSRFRDVFLSGASGSTSLKQMASQETLGQLVIAAGTLQAAPLSHPPAQPLTVVSVSVESRAVRDLCAHYATMLLLAYEQFYNGPPSTTQSILIIPVTRSDPQQPAINGISLPGVISLMLPINLDLQSPEIKRYLAHFIAHELGHIWIGQQATAGIAEAELAWFIEGFTNHIARKMLYASRIYSLDDYLWDLNKAAALAMDSAHMGNAELARRLLENHDSLYQRLPYIRGDMIALWLDQRLLTNSNGGFRLKDALCELLANTQPDKQLSLMEILQTIGKRLSQGDQALLMNFVLDGEPVPLEPSAFSRCLSTSTDQGFTKFSRAKQAGGVDVCPAML